MADAEKEVEVTLPQTLQCLAVSSSVRNPFSLEDTIDPALSNRDIHLMVLDGIPTRDSNCLSGHPGLLEVMLKLILPDCSHGGLRRGLFTGTQSGPVGKRTVMHDFSN